MPGRGVDRLLAFVEAASAASAAVIVSMNGLEGTALGVHFSARDASRTLFVFSIAFLLRAWFAAPPRTGSAAAPEARALASCYAAWRGKSPGDGSALAPFLAAAAAWGAGGAALGLADLTGLRLTHPDLFPGWRDLFLTGAGAVLLHGAVFALLGAPAAALSRALRRAPPEGSGGLALLPLVATPLLAGHRSVWSLPAGESGGTAAGVCSLLALAVAGLLLGFALPRLMRGVPLPPGASAALLAGALAGSAFIVNRPAALPVVSEGSSASASTAAGPPALLLVTVDTLRADKLGCYGNPKVRTPRLDRLAVSGTRCETAICTIPETGPSHLSILSGRIPKNHGARANGQHPVAMPSLAPLLAARGYETGAIVSGYTLKAALAGTGDGFESYDEHFSPFAGMTGLSLVAWLRERGAVSYVTLWKIWAERRGDATTRKAIAWLRARPAGSPPFFLWVHYFDPHGPYDPPPPWNRMYYSGNERDPANRSMDGVEIIHPHQEKPGVTDVGFYVASYEGEVSWVDEQIGLLLDELDREALRPRTLVVLTADHGESLTEHGYHFAHGGDLFEPSVRVPLLFSGPGVASGEVLHPLARSVDIAPTILDLLDPAGDGSGAGLLGPVDGRSLAAALRGEERPASGEPIDRLLAEAQPELAFDGGAPPAWIEGEITRERNGERFDDPVAGKRIAIRTQDFKIVRTPGPDGRKSDALYDLVQDPGELADVAASWPRLSRFLGERLDEWQAAPAGAAGERTLSDQERQVLESLGYAGR